MAHAVQVRGVQPSYAHIVTNGSPSILTQLVFHAMRTPAALSLVLVLALCAPVRAQTATRGGSEWLLTAAPVGISHVRQVGGPIGVGFVVTGPIFGVEMGGDGGSSPTYVASAALAVEWTTRHVIWRLAPGAVVLTGNDWGQAYPGFHAGARTVVRVGRFDLAVGLEAVAVRIAGGNGSGDWRAIVGPLVGIRL